MIIPEISGEPAGRERAEQRTAERGCATFRAGGAIAQAGQ